MNESLAKMLHKFGNTHTVKNFKGRTPYVERRGSGSSYDEKGEITPNSKKASDVFDMSCLLYTSPSPRDVEESRMPSSA